MPFKGYDLEIRARCSGFMDDPLGSDVVSSHFSSVMKQRGLTHGSRCVRLALKEELALSPNQFLLSRS